MADPRRVFLCKKLPSLLAFWIGELYLMVWSMQGGGMEIV